MYQLSRLMLILTVVACCFGILVALVAVILGGWRSSPFPSLCSRSQPGVIPQVFTAHGTARWATLKDLRYAGMVGAKRGPIIGRMSEQFQNPASEGSE